MNGSYGVICTERKHAAQGYFKMVAVTEAGRPTAVKQYSPQSESDQAEWRRVEKLGDFRRQMKRQ